MTAIQKLIMEIEADVKKVVVKANSIDPGRFGHIQQQAITGFQKGIGGQLYCEIGQLKNAFDLQEADIKKANEEAKNKA